MILALSQNINGRMCDVRNSVILEPKQQPVFLLFLTRHVGISFLKRHVFAK